jgi:ferredoxin
VSADQQHYFEINARLARCWPVMARAKAALPDADRWAQMRQKAELLDEAAGDAH